MSVLCSRCVHIAMMADCLMLVQILISRLQVVLWLMNDDRRSGSTVATRNMSRTQTRSTSSSRTLIRTRSRTPSGRRRTLATGWRLKRWKKKWQMMRRRRSKYEELQKVKRYLLGSVFLVVLA